MKVNTHYQWKNTLISKELNESKHVCAQTEKSDEEVKI